MIKITDIEVGYRGGPNLIYALKIENISQQSRRKVRGMCCEKHLTCIAGLRDGGRGHGQAVQVSSRSWKLKETDAPLGPLKELCPANTLILA